MKKYLGATFNGCLKTDPNETVEVMTLDLGMIPEDVMINKVSPLLEQLNSVLNEHKVYIWSAMDYLEEKDTEN